MLKIGIKKHQVTSHFALSNIQIKVKSGEIYALIGKSGSGKSTLLSILGGLETPTSIIPSVALLDNAKRDKGTPS